MGGVEKEWTINYLHKSTERLLYARAIHEENDKGSWSRRHTLCFSPEFLWQLWQAVAQEPTGEWQVASPQSACVCVRVSACVCAPAGVKRLLLGDGGGELSACRSH